VASSHTKSKRSGNPGGRPILRDTHPSWLGIPARAARAAAGFKEKRALSFFDQTLSFDQKVKQARRGCRGTTKPGQRAGKELPVGSQAKLPGVTSCSDAGPKSLKIDVAVNESITCQSVRRRLPAACERTENRQRTSLPCVTSCSDAGPKWLKGSVAMNKSTWKDLRSQARRLQTAMKSNIVVCIKMFQA